MLLKNQLFQAMCAIEAADILGKKLQFHVNGDILNPHNPVLKNLEKLFLFEVFNYEDNNPQRGHCYCSYSNSYCK